MLFMLLRHQIRNISTNFPVSKNNFLYAQMLLVLLLCTGLFGDGVRAAPEPASDVILRYRGQ
jgi:hypothetical protein